MAGNKVPCPLQRWHGALTTHGPSLPTSTTRCCRARSPGQHTWPGEGGEEEEGGEREGKTKREMFFFSPALVLGPSSEFDVLWFCVRTPGFSLTPTSELAYWPNKVRSPSKIVESQFAPLVVRCATVSLLLQSWGELQHSASAASRNPFQFFFLHYLLKFIPKEP